MWLCANWGEEKWVGLTGLALVDSAGQLLSPQLVTTEVPAIT